MPSRLRDRQRFPVFFGFARALKGFDVLFFAILTLVCGAFFFEAVGVIS